MKEQTEQVIKNLAGVLAKAGTSLDYVVKTTVFIKDMNQFSVMNETYAAVCSLSSTTCWISIYPILSGLWVKPPRSLNDRGRPPAQGCAG